jgi:glycerol-3-phosphate dehydrogenase
MLGTAKSLTDLGASFGATLTGSEIKSRMASEWAMTAEDIVWRRSKLGLRLSVDEVAAIDAWIAAQRVKPGSPVLEAGGRS